MTERHNVRLIAIPNQMRDDGQCFLCFDVPPQPYPGVATMSGAPIMQLPPAICGMGMPEADAKRLAACWNACEGVSNEELASGVRLAATLQALKELVSCMPGRMERGAS